MAGVLRGWWRQGRAVVTTATTVMGAPATPAWLPTAARVATMATGVPAAGTAPAPAGARSSAATPAAAAVEGLTPRLTDTFRLRPRQRLRDLIPYIASVEVSYDPAMEGTSGVKELWRQVNSGKIRSQHPKLVTKMETNASYQPARVMVKFVDGRTLDIAATGSSVADLFDEMSEFTAELEEKDDLAELDKA